MRNLQSLLMVLLTAIVFLNFPAWANAQDLPERPNTRDLLPETTVALLKVRNIQELAEKMRDSKFGEMMESESVGPLVNGLYENVNRQYERVQEKVGLSMEEIRSLPTGEITIAVIAPRRKDIAYIVMLETDEDNEAVDTILDSGRAALNEETETEESENGVTIETVNIQGNLTYFVKHEGLLIASTSRDELDGVFTRWAGGEVSKVRALASNRKFATISKRCAVSDETLPDMRFFVDPIEIFKASARGNMGMQFAVSILPSLGLDGLLGAGGNVFINYEKYESIAHGHLLMASPRNGLLNAFSLKSADYNPEPWVQENIATYMSTSWDVPQMLGSIKSISDSFAEGQYDEFFLGMQETLDERSIEVDIQTDLIDLLSGRVTVVRPILPEDSINGIGNSISFGINDNEKFEETLNTLMAAKEVTQWLSAREYKGNAYWTTSDESLERRKKREGEYRERLRKRREKRGEKEPEKRPALDLRQPEPAIGIIGNSLLITDSQEAFEFAVDTFQGNLESLAESELFQEQMDTMTKLIGTKLPAAVFFSDGPREFKHYLSAMDSDSLKEVISFRAERDESGFLRDVQSSIEEHGFPNFEDIEQYLSVSGGFVTTDDSGYHFLFFQKKPEEK